jgi:hypothetical protein
MILDFIEAYQIPLFLFVEVMLLLCLYRYLLRQWIFDHWEEKVQEDDGEWLKEILYPVTDEVISKILEYAPDLIIKKVKHEILASQGTLTRVANAEPENEMEAGLGIAESILMQMGWKRPNALLVAKMAGVLGNMMGTQEKEEAKSAPAPLPLGDDLINI